MIEAGSRPQPRHRTRLVGMQQLGGAAYWRHYSGMLRINSSLSSVRPLFRGKTALEIKYLFQERHRNDVVRTGGTEDIPTPPINECLEYS